MLKMNKIRIGVFLTSVILGCLVAFASNFLSKEESKAVGFLFVTPEHIASWPRVAEAMGNFMQGSGGSEVMDLCGWTIDDFSNYMTTGKSSSLSVKSELGLVRIESTLDSRERTRKCVESVGLRLRSSIIEDAKLYGRETASFRADLSPIYDAPKRPKQKRLLFIGFLSFLLCFGIGLLISESNLHRRS